MGAIRDSVQVTISRATAAVAGQGFGIPLFLAVHDQSETTYLVTSPSDAASKYGDNSPIVSAMNAFWGQQTGPTGVVIGKIVNDKTGLASTQESVVTISGTEFVEDSVATIQIGNWAVSYTLGTSEDAETVATALVGLISADPVLSQKVSAVNNLGVITISCIGAISAFSLLASATNVGIGDMECAVTTAWSTAFGQNTTLTVNYAIYGQIYYIIINNQRISYTAKLTDTVDSIALALASAIAENVYLTDQVVVVIKNSAPDTLYITAYNSDIAFSLDAYAIANDPTPIPSAFTEGTMSDMVYTITSDLDNALMADNTWYGITCQHIGYVAQRTADAEAIAEANKGYGAAGNPKLFGTVTNEQASADVAYQIGVLTDLGNYMRNKAFDRTFWIFNEGQSDYIECAWMGLQFSKTPGSSTWKFKQLSGPVPDNLTAQQRENINHFLKIKGQSGSVGKNGNFFESIAGVNIISSEGTVANGEYIDVMYGIDYLTARISEEVFAYLVSQEKVPFTNAGINAVASKIRAVLESNPSLIDTTTIQLTIPTVDQVSVTDRANRYLNKIAFSARLTGAIQSVLIEGKLSV